MFSRVTATVVLFSILTPSFVHAQQPSPSSTKDELIVAKSTAGGDDADPGKVMTPLKKGQKTPYTGVLLAPASVASIVVELESIPEKIRLETDKVQNVCQAKCERNLADVETKLNADKKILQTQIETDKKEIDAYQEQIKKLKDQQTNPFVWLGVGTAGGIALTLLTVFAVSSATK